MELLRLVAASQDEELTPDSLRRLETILAESPTARRRYIQLTAFFINLRFQCAALPPDSSIATVAAKDSPPYGMIPVIATNARHWDGSALSGAFVNSSAGWPVAYLVATVVLCAGILVASITYVSRPTEVAGVVPSHAAVTKSDFPQQEQEVVGRITRMVDCEWNGAETPPKQRSRVTLGSKYTLASGVMEITYDTGARIILQGPVTYQLESKNGGLLSIGKLTGKATTEAAHGLTIRTPTAVVTDLGTEFSVEVSKEGDTASHVFSGSVRLETVQTAKGAKSVFRVLHKNESARVEKDPTTNGVGLRIVVSPLEAATGDFVREVDDGVLNLAKNSIDLADVVAGGDGFSGHRNRGIDATNGRIVMSPPCQTQGWLSDDGRYHHVDGRPFIDGVFIPSRLSGMVQTDSALHTFDAFDTESNATAGYIWSGGGPRFADDANRPMPTVLGGVNYAVPGHSVLHMHANQGITFDLNAMRRANPGHKLTRFRTVVGHAPADSLRCRLTQPIVLFQDDFDAAPAGTWPTQMEFPPMPKVGRWTFSEMPPKTCQYQVLNNSKPGAPDAGSNHYLRVIRAADDRSSLVVHGWNPSLTTNQIVEVSASVWLDKGDGVAVLDGFTEDNFQGRSYSVFLHGNGSVKFFDGDDFVDTGLVSHPNTWQNVVITANMAAKTFSIKLDDQPVFKGGRWPTGATAVAVATIMPSYRAIGVYFDNIKIMAIPNPSADESNASSSPTATAADVWLLVDGERRSGRRDVSCDSGDYAIAIPINDKDQFLTLATTGSGTGLCNKWILFGDPRVEMIPVNREGKKSR
jgi:hypothetical protein